ncbi:MAG: hypothetical protein C0606_13215 [Hyphomicrobiales bacterium]|nr:MAG: hypothetical protein C0606_13215 [Hyphomicrobiales bacterium]
MGMRWTHGLAGLAAVGILTGGGSLMKLSPVEGDLSERSAAGLVEDAQPWASTTFDGRDAVLTGQAPTPEEQNLARKAVERVWGVRKVVDNTEVIPVADPYVVSLSRERDAFTLSGSAPRESVKQALVEKAGEVAGGSVVSEEMTLSRGAPAGLAEGFGYVAEIVGELGAGIATWTGSTIAVSGVARDAMSYVSALEKVEGGAPSGFQFGTVDIKAPVVEPYLWSADKSGSGVRLAGFVGDQAGRAALYERAGALGAVSDDMAYGSGAPHGFSDMTTFALTQLGNFDDGSARFDGKTLSISGALASREGQAAFAEALSVGNVAGIPVAAGEIAGPVVSPFEWSAMKSADGVVLDGAVPDAMSRRVLVDAAAGLNAGAVNDQMLLSRGNAANFPTLASYGLSRLALLAPGATASISDNVLTLSGEALSREAYAALREGADAPGLGGASIRANVTQPVVSPYVWGAAVSGSTVTLNGYVPDDDTRGKLIDLARTKFGGFSVDDQMAIGDGAPDGFLNAASAALQAASRLGEGQVSLSDQSLVASGATYHQGALQAVRAALSGHLPAGFAAQSDSLAVQAPGAAVSALECQDLLTGRMASSRILFDSGKASIQEHSFGLLDNLVYMAQRCPMAGIEIEGHTDADGSDEANQALSEARARAVADYLGGAGVAGDRLSAIGYGESRPVASNDTDEGKAQNRRIEFRVVEE